MTPPKRAPQIVHGDCLDIMKMLPDNSVDSIVTDPPYGLGFMGKAWDKLPPGLEWAQECLRVLKPGGHLLAFGGSRTWHRLAVAVEDAGFEIRDSIAWLYGSGFPKSLDVSKAIDKAAGAEREVTGKRKRPGGPAGMTKASGWNDGPMAHDDATVDITVPATEEAGQWQGWGTALKPAFEPVVMGRKPLVGTVAANVQAYGTGALNIDATRIDADGRPLRINSGKKDPNGFGNKFGSVAAGVTTAGRWPANVVLDETTAPLLDQQSGTVKSSPFNTIAGHAHGNGSTHGTFIAKESNEGGYSDSGGASRFFKVAKADERGAISEFFPREFDAPFLYVAKAPKKERPVVDGVAHATVKPLALMRWLVRLVTPDGGTVLEPFAGSGTTVEACILEGFHCIAIEREAEYLPLIQARIDRQEAA